jgi:hypothetical protein
MWQIVRATRSQILNLPAIANRWTMNTTLLSIYDVLSTLNTIYKHAQKQRKHSHLQGAVTHPARFVHVMTEET